MARTDFLISLATLCLLVGMLCALWWGSLLWWIVAVIAAAFVLASDKTSVRDELRELERKYEGVPENVGLKRRYCGTHGTWTMTVEAFFGNLVMYAAFLTPMMLLWNCVFCFLVGVAPFSFEVELVVLFALAFLASEFGL